MTEQVETVVLREGMIAIRCVLNGVCEWGLEPIEARVKVATRLADALHNVSGLSHTAAYLAAREIRQLVSDEPRLSSLLLQSHGWAEEKTKQDG